MRTRKVISLVVAAIMLISLTACGKTKYKKIEELKASSELLFTVEDHENYSSDEGVDVKLYDSYVLYSDGSLEITTNYSELGTFIGYFDVTDDELMTIYRGAFDLYNEGDYVSGEDVTQPQYIFRYEGTEIYRGDIIDSIGNLPNIMEILSSYCAKIPLDDGRQNSIYAPESVTFTSQVIGEEGDLEVTAYELAVGDVIEMMGVSIEVTYIDDIQVFFDTNTAVYSFMSDGVTLNYGDEHYDFFITHEQNAVIGTEVDGNIVSITVAYQ